MLITPEIQKKLDEIDRKYFDPGNKLHKRQEVLFGFVLDCVELEIGKIQDTMMKNLNFILRKRKIYSMKQLATSISISTGYEIDAAFLGRMKTGQTFMRSIKTPIVLALWLEVPLVDFMFIDMQARDEMKWDLKKKEY